MKVKIILISLALISLPFGDAYIDKLWLVIRDDVRRKDNYRLVNSAYRSNIGGSPDEIARNAQIAQAQGQY